MNATETRTHAVKCPRCNKKFSKANPMGDTHGYHDLCAPRIRFNWGFHDGTAEAQLGNVRDMSGHFDSVYAEGYRAGLAAFRATGTRPESSEAAWLAR
jgi:hypothetical protein